MELTTTKAKTIIDGVHWLCFQVSPYEAGRVLESWKDGKVYALEVKPKRKKRSRDANNYMWALCDEIAEAIRSTPEDVYRDAVRDVGVFHDGRYKKEEVNDIQAIWKSNGIAWFCLIDKSSYSEADGMVTMRFYHGSSIYDTKQMSRLLDWVVDEAKELGIETLDEMEINRMAEEWGKKKDGTA